MGWNLDTSIQGSSAGGYIARNYTYATPAQDVPIGGGVRVWTWYNIAVPSGAKRVQVTAGPSARAGANAAGFYYLILSNSDGSYNELSSVRFHNNTMWYASWNHTLTGTRNVPQGGTVGVWVDCYNDSGSGTAAYTRNCHFKLDWFA